jgi:amino acid permease
MYLRGTGSAVIAYLLMGSLMRSANASLAEMSAVFPVKGPIIDIPSRFINGGVGFAIGLMAWYGYTPVLVADTLYLQVCIHHLNRRRNLGGRISLQILL